MIPPPAAVETPATLTPVSKGYRDLVQLPEPKGKIVVAVYGFRDLTGQYKSAPDSTFSTVVTQGAAAMLIKALKDSGWFIPVEREGLQNLLTERRIVRALELPQDKAAPAFQLPPLMPATLLIEGGIVAYESNVKTGGAGARYLGVGVSGQYRMDQVTINLRAVDIRSGQVVNTLSTTKTIYSRQINANIFKFVRFKELLEAEIGYTRNEPAQLCVREAIEAGVIRLIAQGVKDKTWALKSESDLESPTLQVYLREDADLLKEAPEGQASDETP